MKKARVAAVVTWLYAAAFGIPAIPVAAYLLQRGMLPTFLDLFPMYGGPWSETLDDRTFVALLMAFLLVMGVASWTAWSIRRGSRIGAVLNLALLPVEVVFWIGFALPLPWLIGAARALLLAGTWKSLD
jgi:hypothetical protein